MPTLTELVQRVGEDLALVPIGQGLQTQDEVRIRQAYTEIYQRIKAKGLATWTSTGDIPDLVSGFVSLMIMENLLTTYRVPVETYQRIKLAAGDFGNLALQKIAEVVTPATDNVDDVEDF